MCWQTYDEAAQQAAKSRLYAGIHISLDNEDGLKLGKAVGANVVSALSRLSPANFLVKEKVTTRTDPLGDPDRQTFPLEELICPPGTFLRVLDGQADGAGLYALGLTCSDGTFIGSLGYWGRGSYFAQTTEADGYCEVRAGISEGSAVALSFMSRNADAAGPMYGLASAPQFQTRRCSDGERIVGLGVRRNGAFGNVGSIQVLCGACPTAVSYRITPVPEVPSGPPEGFAVYDYQCPDNTFVTRVFGRAGSSYLETLTAQCAGYWNLNTIGVPYFSMNTPPYTHTSTEGYTGIMVKNYSGGIDSIAFVTASGMVSPMFGADVPGTPIFLNCTEGDKVIGFYGNMSESVETIGITCGSGISEASTQSIQELHRRRNPRHVLRLRGGPPITPETLQTTSLSALVKTKRAPTKVVGRAKRTFPPVTGANVAALKHQAAVSASKLSPAAAHAAGDANKATWLQIDDAVLGPYPPPL